jgi:hypothetical protein
MAAPAIRWQQMPIYGVIMRSTWSVATTPLANDGKREQEWGDQ